MPRVSRGTSFLEGAGRIAILKAALARKQTAQRCRPNPKRSQQREPRTTRDVRALAPRPVAGHMNIIGFARSVPVLRWRHRSATPDRPLKAQVARCG